LLTLERLRSTGPKAKVGIEAVKKKLNLQTLKCIDKADIRKEENAIKKQTAPSNRISGLSEQSVLNQKENNRRSFSAKVIR